MSDITPIQPEPATNRPRRRIAAIAAAIGVLLLLANVALAGVAVVTLGEIKANTAPPTYLRAFCENDAEMSDLYEEMVYENTDNINQQAHRQREFRAQVLIYCNR